MRIAFVLERFPLLSETFILNQITGLLDQGHDVHIYAKKPIKTDIVQEDVHRYGLMSRTRYFSDIPKDHMARIFKALRLMVQNHAWRYPLVILSTLNFWKFGKAALSLKILYTAIPFIGQKYDIIHCQFGTVGVLMLPLKKMGLISSKFVISFRGNDLTGKLNTNRMDYRELFKEGGLFLPVSQYFKAQLIAEGCNKDKIVIHRSGLNLQHFDFRMRKLSNKGPVNFISVGRFVEKKGFPFAIEAVAQLIRSGYDISYTIIGYGELRVELERLIKKFDLMSKIIILGPMSQSEVINYLQNSHVLIAPSVTGSDGDQEGIPNTLKEAMAMGLPVVGTFHGGIPELIDDGKSGFLVPEYDIDALSDRLAYVIDHPEICREALMNARRHIEKEYDINVLNSELVNLYSNMG